jgi:hypothetical protein
MDTADSGLDLRVEVTLGQIIINTIDLAMDHEDAKVLLIDCHTKRGEVAKGWGSSVECDEFILRLTSNEESLGAAEVERPTEVRIQDLGEHWNLEAFYCRYTVYVFLWRLTPSSDSFRNLWTHQR